MSYLGWISDEQVIACFKELPGIYFNRMRKNTYKSVRIASIHLRFEMETCGT
jgi:hypothetical protein